MMNSRLFISNPQGSLIPDFFRQVKMFLEISEIFARGGKSPGETNPPRARAPLQGMPTASGLLDGDEHHKPEPADTLNQSMKLHNLLPELQYNNCDEPIASPLG
jgi:hypothetical protein